MRSAEIELQNKIELRATASAIAAPKPDPSTPKQKKDDFEALFKRQIDSAKNAKICWQITIAAWMQPLQYDLRDLAAKDNSITQAAAAPSNIHAAIPMRSATTNSRNAWNYAHRNNHCCKTHIEGTKRPQPHPPHTRGTFHRRLQPLYTEKHKVSCSGFLPTTHGMQHSCSHSNAICNHSFKKRIELRTQEQPLVAKHIEGTKRPQPHPPHTRGTFHRRLQPLYTEKHKVSCSGFLPTTHGMQHSCSHSNAICNHGYKKRMELRTQEQPLLQNT